ncbi:hypothetical protein ACLB2K_023077 [Fragaria x ananassa]
METSELDDPSSIYHEDVQPECHQDEVEVHHEVEYGVVLEATFGNNSANYDQNQQPHGGGQPRPYFHQQPLPGQPQPSPPYLQPLQYPPQPTPMQYPPPRPPRPVPPSPHHQVYTPPHVYKPPQPPPIGSEPWKTGLFDCMEDPNIAVTTALVPCLTFGQIAEVVDDGNTIVYVLQHAQQADCYMGWSQRSVACHACIVSCAYRTKIMNMYGLVEAPASDWLTHLFCEPCALCQEYKELQRRGLDPSRGWQGNAAASGMNVRSHMTPPVINHRMN